MFLSFTIASLAYGGLHLLAWNAPFPSFNQSALWKGSGVLIASSGLILVGMLLTALAWGLVYDALDRTEKVKKYRKWYPILLTMFFLLVLLLGIGAIAFVCLLPVYVLARGYLVVESIIQLMHLPDSAYMLPQWSKYFPHIS